MWWLCGGFALMGAAFKGYGVYMQWHDWDAWDTSMALSHCGYLCLALAAGIALCQMIL